MNCRNAFQIYLNLENCMTNRVSFSALKKGDIYRKELSMLCCTPALIFPLHKSTRTSFFDGMRYSNIVMLAFCSFLCKVCSKRLIPMADIFGRIVKGISKIARTTFFHMGITVIKLPRLIGGWRHSSVSKYLIRLSQND